MLFIPTPTSKLKPILEYYVETVSIRKRSYKTEVYRIKALSSLLGDLVFNEIKPIHVVAYRDKRLATPHPRDSTKTLATSTVKLELMLLSHLFTTAITEWGMEDLINPVEKVRKPKAPPGRTRRLSPAEEKKVLRGAWRHPNKEVYAIIVLALETAMRQGEILSLRWENISWQKRTVLLPLTKNGEPREVPLSKAAYNILRNYMTPLSEGRVFSYTSNGLKSSWRIFVKGLGIDDLHFHDLRHCAISSLLERGLNTIEVASISGHKSMAMLKRYSHLMTYKLVAKLDPKPRAKKDRPILRDQLRAYPAVVTEHTNRVDVDFPDFINLRLSSKTVDHAIQGAQAGLLREVVTLLCDGSVPPEPSSPETICLPTDKSRVEIISPI